MNYEAERAMNQKRLRMDGEPGHGVVQGNGLPLNYMDNGHQIPYQPYASAYNTHYPPPDAFAAYGPPPPGGYAPQNLSYAPPAHQNYPHHQTFPPQQPQAQLHMPQTHMGYGEVPMHKPSWPPQPHLLPPLEAQKTLDIKQLKPEIKLEPSDTQKRPHPENEMMSGDPDQPKIKIKTDIFKPDDLVHKPDLSKDVMLKSAEAIPKPLDLPHKEIMPADSQEKLLESCKPDVDSNSDPSRSMEPTSTTDKREGDVKSESFSSPDRPKSSTTPKSVTPGSEPKKRGRPKGSTNKPKPIGLSPKLLPNTPTATPQLTGVTPQSQRPTPLGRPRGTGYQYAIRPFRKDFSGIQFRRRWSDDCLDSSHIPNEVYFGDVPVPLSVLHNYYDAHADRERLAAQAAHIAAQKSAAAKIHAAKIHARHVLTGEVTTVDSSSSDDSSGSSGSDDSDSDDEQPLKKGPGRPKGSRNSTTPKTPRPTGGKRGRPPVPPELREPGVTEVKKFCKAAGIRFDYKKLVEGCTKNKERVSKMMELLVAAGLEGKPTLEKCRALKVAKNERREEEKRAKKEAKTKVTERNADKDSGSRRVTRGQSGVKPRQKIVISSDEEDDTPESRRTLSKLRDLADDSDDN